MGVGLGKHKVDQDNGRKFLFIIDPLNSSKKYQLVRYVAIIIHWATTSAIQY